MNWRQPEAAARYIEEARTAGVTAETLDPLQVRVKDLAASQSRLSIEKVNTLLQESHLDSYRQSTWGVDICHHLYSALKTSKLGTAEFHANTQAQVIRSLRTFFEKNAAIYEARALNATQPYGGKGSYSAEDFLN